ncbi:MAG: hypothetical protein ACK561_09960 [Pseudomonadaceae bacterium]
MSTRKKKPRTAKVRAQDTARQRRKRELDARHREAVGAKTFKWETYTGTRDDMECIRQVGGFELVEEGLTLAVRYMAGFARRDPAGFRAAIDPRNPV